MHTHTLSQGLVVSYFSLFYHFIVNKVVYKLTTCFTENFKFLGYMISYKLLYMHALYREMRYFST